METFFILMTLLCKKYPLLSPLQASFPFILDKTNSTSNGVLENEAITCNTPVLSSSVRTWVLGEIAVRWW